VSEQNKGLAIYVGKEKLELASPDAHITREQVDLLSRKTPPKYIKKRKGRGGKELSYVEINYVQAVLNAVFAFDWDVKVIDRIVSMQDNFIAMLVELTLRFADGHVVTKHAWGGADIKRAADGSGKLVDFADDLKAAQSDGIKKAASMAGVAWDVFSGLSEWANEPEQQPQPLSKFHLLKELGELKTKMGDESYYYVLHKAGYNHANEIPPQNRDAAIKVLQAVYLKLQEKSDEKKVAQNPQD
jgi:hypothetical protein